MKPNINESKNFSLLLLNDFIVYLINVLSTNIKINKSNK